MLFASILCSECNYAHLIDIRGKSEILSYLPGSQKSVRDKARV